MYIVVSGDPVKGFAVVDPLAAKITADPRQNEVERLERPLGLFGEQGGVPCDVGFRIA